MIEEQASAPPVPPPPSSSRRVVARCVSVENVADVCAFVDELGASEVGELVISGSGSVFIEGRCICWAAAPDLARRLSELLIERAGVEPSAMENYFRTCKAEQVPLGEYLVGRSIIVADDLRAVLAQHTIESLIRLVPGRKEASWCPRPRGGYSPRFTFGTAEILARATALGAESLAERARSEMSICFNDDEWAAAFVRSESRALPTPIALFGKAPSSASALGRLAKWASSSLDLVEAFGDRNSAPIISVTTPRTTLSPIAPRRHEALIAFRYESTIIAGETGAHCAARILNRQARARLASSER